MVEYKMDERDGQPKLMEINGRFWGSLQLASDAGLNFPLLLYRLACGEQVLPQLTYRSHVKSRWLLGDLDQLWIRMKSSHKYQGASRKRALINFLRFYEPDLHYEIFRLEDPVPGWYEWREYMAIVLRQAVSRKTEAHAH